MKIMNFSEAECHECYKCVRTCKVKAIKIEEQQAHIMSDKCIACGQCFSSCPQNARNIHSDLSYVKKLIKVGGKVSVSIAPSFRGFFPESDKFITGLRTLGFNIIEETAVGADITTKLYRDYIDKESSKTYITTCCPSVILLIERYYPDLIPYLMPFTSPMVTHGKLLKDKNKDNPVVFIGPCIAKKCESLSKEYEEVIDAVLTFDEIQEWLKDLDIDYSSLDDGEVDRFGSTTGKSYPVVGGILEGIREKLKEKSLIHMRVDGVDECIEIFDEISRGNIEGVCVEVSACNKSCLGGPSGSTVSSSTHTRVKRLKEYLDKRVVKEQPVQQCSEISFKAEFSSKIIDEPMPTKEEIREIMISFDKFKVEDELNCGGCGYETCRENAVSIFKGMSQADMCLHYVKRRNERISNEIFENSPNGILILDNENNILESNIAFSRYFGLTPRELKGSSPIMFSTLYPLSKYITDKKRILWEKIIFVEANLYMRLSLIPMDSREASIVILTDITSEEMRKKDIRALQEKTLLITQDVVVKQMRVAQEIASLLGETTAETKVALNKVRDVFEDKEES